jgi:hypothetical protein
MLVLILLMITESTVSVVIMILSHPALDTKVSIYTPEVDSYEPPGSCKLSPVQIPAATLSLVTEFTIRVVVIILSHPSTLGRVSLYDPAIET